MSSILTTLRSLLGRQRNALNDPRYGLSFGRIIPGSDIDASPIDTKREAAEAYAGWVFAASTFLADEVRSLDWSLYRLTGETRDEWTKDTRNPITQVLRKPNPTESWADLAERSVISFNVHGEFYWHILRSDSGGRAIGLALILPHWVDEPTFDRDGRHDGWRVTVPGYAPKKLPIEDVVRVYRPHPLSPWMAASVVEAAAVSHYFDLYLRAYGMTVFRNDGGVPAGLLSSDQELSPEQADDMRERWRQRYSKSRGEVAVLGANAKYQPISIPMGDLKFLEIGKFTRDQVLAMYRVPSSLLGMDEAGVNRASIEGHLYGFQRHALRPLARRIEGAVRDHVLPAFMGPTASGYWWEFDNVVMKDRTGIRAEALEALTAGAITVNEYRQKLDMDPVDDGDVYRIPTSVSLKDTLAPAQPPPQFTSPVVEEDEAAARSWEANVIAAAANRRADAAEAIALQLKREADERRAYSALRGLFAGWWRDRDPTAGTLPLTGLDEHHLTAADLPDVSDNEDLHAWVERLKGSDGKRLAALSVERSQA